jgi:DNA-binding MarR family transcriptional regulator
MRTTSHKRERAATIRRAATSLASRARAERAGELSLNQTAVLGRIAVQGPITPGEVAEQLRMLPQSLTRTFAALEAGGLVRRMPDPGDGRQSLLVVTAEGRTALRAEMAPRDRWLARAMSALLTEQESQELLHAAELMLRLADFESDVAVAEL